MKPGKHGYYITGKKRKNQEGHPVICQLYPVLSNNTAASLTSFETASLRRPLATLGATKRGLGVTFPTLSCRTIARHPSPQSGRRPQGDPSPYASGRQKERLGVTAHPCLPEARFPFCLPEARKRRGTPRFARGDKKREARGDKKREARGDKKREARGDKKELPWRALKIVS